MGINIGDPMLEGVTHGQQYTMSGSGLCVMELRPTLVTTEVSGQSNVPTTVTRGVVPGISLPIWNSNSEQLFFDICVPDRWDETSDIDIHIYCYLSAIQPTSARAFKLQVDWEHYAPTSVAPDTSNTIAVETELDVDTAAYTGFKVIFTGANAINYDVDGGGNEVAADENLCMRLRRIDKTGGNNEIDGEIIITHVGLLFQRDKLGTGV